MSSIGTFVGASTMLMMLPLADWPNTISLLWQTQFLVQKKNITCKSPIEKVYYNNEGRRLKPNEICIHCGERFQRLSIGSTTGVEGQRKNTNHMAKGELRS